MITAANTPHTITNVLMICFSSETDIGQTDLARSKTTPVIGVAGVVALISVRCVRGGAKHFASVLNATKPDRTIVLECNGPDCTNSMVRCGPNSPHTITSALCPSVLVILRLFTATIYGITHLVEYKDPEGRHALPLFLAHRIVERLPRLGEPIQIL